MYIDVVLTLRYGTKMISISQLILCICVLLINIIMVFIFQYIIYTIYYEDIIKYRDLVYYHNYKNIYSRSLEYYLLKQKTVIGI